MKAEILFTVITNPYKLYVAIDLRVQSLACCH